MRNSAASAIGSTSSASLAFTCETAITLCSRFQTRTASASSLALAACLAAADSAARAAAKSPASSSSEPSSSSAPACVGAYCSTFACRATSRAACSPSR